MVTAAAPRRPNRLPSEVGSAVGRVHRPVILENLCLGSCLMKMR